MLWATSEVVLLLFTLLAFACALEAGFRVGRRRYAVADEAERSHVAMLQGAMLGLLALLLGFTFAMAVSRFDNRKALVLQEANAIGTTALRADFVSPPAAAEVRELLRGYVAASLAFYDAGIDAARVASAAEAAARIERRLWAIATAAASADTHSTTTALFSRSVNDLIDLREKRRIALDDHVPEAVMHLLCASSFLALALVAYGCGLSGKRRLGVNALFALVVALVLTTILDIDRPRRGLVQVSQDSLLRVKASLDAPAR